MLFDSSLRRELARSFGATLVILLTIVLTVMFIRTLGQAALGRVSPADVMLLLAYIGLGNLSTILALSLFIAVVATLSRMYRGSEMAIWFASGVPLGRFVRPVFATAWPVLVVIAALSLFVWPWQNQQSAELKDRYERRSDLSRAAPGEFQTSADGKRTFFFEGSASDPTLGRNVFIVDGRGGVESVTSAHSGAIVNDAEGRAIVLKQGQRNDETTARGEKTLFRFETYRALVDDRILPTGGEVPPRARSSAELLFEPTRANQAELAWRIGFVLAAANMLVIGVGISASNPRHASNWNLLFAGLAFFTYYNLINLSQSWIRTGKAGFGPALLALHGGALAIGLALLWWRERSTVGVVMRRRRPRPAPAAA